MHNNTFDALANTHRRQLLVALVEENPQTDTVQRPPDTDGAVSDHERWSHIQMQHIHLPKLEDRGFIQWEKETGEINRGPAFEEIRPLLEWIRSGT